MIVSLKKIIFLATVLLTVNSCGGDASSTFSEVIAPPDLQNQAPMSYLAHDTISNLKFENTGGGNLNSCSSNLPAGLNIAIASNGYTCEISEAPTEVVAKTTYYITASNEIGSSTATIDVEIAKPGFSISGIVSKTINENQPYASNTLGLIGTYVVDGSLTYFFNGGSDDSLFALNASTGVVTMASQDHENLSDRQQ